jgi:hypothetical protein
MSLLLDGCEEAIEVGVKPLDLSRTTHGRDLSKGLIL